MRARPRQRPCPHGRERPPSANTNWSARALPAHVQREAPYPTTERKRSFRSERGARAPAVRRPALYASPERSESQKAARPPVCPRNGRAPQLWCPLPLALVVVGFTPRAIPETRYLARSRDDPSNKGGVVHRLRVQSTGVRTTAAPSRRLVLRYSPSNEGRQLGVTRYASKTASMFRSAVSKPRSSLTSPTSATYQFRAI